MTDVSETEVRAATHADIEACVGVLSLAFHDDPGALVFEADSARRSKILPTFFRTFVAASLAEDGDLVVAGDPVEGIASWFGPERHGPSPEAMGAHGFGEVLEAFGPEASERMLAMVGELEVQHERLTDRPHLRLEFFGVLPERQGTGLGSKLSTTATAGRTSSASRATSRRSPRRTCATTSAAATGSWASTWSATACRSAGSCGNPASRSTEEPHAELDRILVAQALLDRQRTPGPEADEVASRGAEPPAVRAAPLVPLDQRIRHPGGGGPGRTARGRRDGLRVTVEREQFVAVASKPPIEGQQRHAGTLLESRDRAPRRRVGPWVERRPVAAARGEQ